MINLTKPKICHCTTVAVVLGESTLMVLATTLYRIPLENSIKYLKVVVKINKEEIKKTYAFYKVLQEKTGLNHKEIAGLAEINPTVIYEWKIGKAMPKGDKIYRLAKVLGVPMERFYE